MNYSSTIPWVPSDLLTSDRFNERRLKADISESAAGIGDLTTDAWGVQKVSLPRSIFHGMWTFDIPPSMWFTYHDGVQVYTSSNIVSENGAAKLDTTGLTSVLLESRETPRYQPNRGHLFSTALVLPNPTAAGQRDFGLFTAESGAFFRLKSDGLLYAVTRNAGIDAEHLIDTSNLNGFDVSKNNIYDIQFQWRGAGNYKFYIGDPKEGVSRLVHVIDNLGKLTAVSIEDPAMPIAFSATNQGADVQMAIGCADITSENGKVDELQYESTFIETLTVNGANDPVLTIYNPLQINGKTNTRIVELARISVTCSKKANFKVWATRDPAAFTGQTLVPLGEGSFVQTDSPDKVAGAVTATAVNTALLRNITSAPVEAAVSREIDNPIRERITFPIVRGDYIVVTCSASTATAECVIEFGEAI